MSKKKLTPVNRETLKLFISMNYDSLKDFAVANGINPNTFYKYLQGDNTLTEINEKIANILGSAEVDPFVKPTLPVISDDTKLMIAGAAYA